MKIDVLLIPVGARYVDMRAAARAAEDAGYDGVWTWDHLRDPDERAEAGVPEAWTTLTALAEATRRITLGPLVLNTGLRHPGVLANMAATLQQVSGGRLLLGLGAGATRSTEARPGGSRYGVGAAVFAVCSHPSTRAASA